MAGMIAGEAFVRIGAILTPLQKGLNQAAASMEQFGAEMQAIGGRMAGAGLAVLTPLAIMTKSFSQSGDALEKLSSKTGVGVEALSVLRHAAALVDTDLSEVSGGLRMMQNTLGDAARGSKEATSALGRLGLNINDLLRLSPEAQFEVLSKAIMSIRSPAERVSAAMDVFGRGATDLFPLMRKLSQDGFPALAKSADKAGVKMSVEAAARAVLLDDALDRLYETIRGVSDAVGNALAPSASFFAEQANKAAEAVVAWLRANERIVVQVAAAAGALTALGLAIAGVGTALTVLAVPLRALSSALGALKVLFSATSLAALSIAAAFVLVADAVAGAAGATNIGIARMIGSVKVGGTTIRGWLQLTWLYGKEQFLSYVDTVRAGFGLAIDSAKVFAANIEPIFKSLANTVSQAFAKAILWILNGFLKILELGKAINDRMPFQLPGTTLIPQKFAGVLASMRDEITENMKRQDDLAKRGQEAAAPWFNIVSGLLGVWNGFFTEKDKRAAESAKRMQDLDKAAADILKTEGKTEDPLSSLIKKGEAEMAKAKELWDKLQKDMATKADEARAEMGAEGPPGAQIKEAEKAFVSFSAREIAGANTTLQKGQAQANRFLAQIVSNTKDLQVGLA